MRAYLLLINEIMNPWTVENVALPYVVLFVDLSDSFSRGRLTFSS